MTDAFSAALADVRGHSWLSRAARSSLIAGRDKFIGRPMDHLMRVELGGSRTLGAADTATVALALQNATAKIGHIIRDPESERTQVRRGDRAQALLIPKAQFGRTLLFAFPDSAETAALPGLEHLPRRSLSEAAALELCSVLPGSAQDDAALDALVSQRKTVRNAVHDIVEAVSNTATDLSIELTLMGDESVRAHVTVEQAEVLADSLRETRTDRRQQQLVGRLDGVRTRRRIFYLQLETGQEIHGAIGSTPGLMDAIRENLDRPVVATVISERVETLDGRVGRPTYRLVGLERPLMLTD